MTDKMNGGGCPACGTKAPVTERKQPEERREQILLAAVGLADPKGYRAITQSEIAEAAGVSRTLVVHYFETMGVLRDAIMRRAILEEIPAIVLQGIVSNDPIAVAAPLRLKAKAVNTIK